MTEEEKRVSHVASVTKYNANNVQQFKMNLNLKTDTDIINRLETKKENKSGYIKDLIRKDIALNP